MTSYAAPAAERVLDILELLVECDGKLILAEISRRLNISMNSTFRLCRVLEARGYLCRDGASGVYSLTSKLYSLGSRMASRMTLISQARPALEWLTQQTGENSHLCVLREEHLLLLDQVISPQPIRVVVETGSLLHPHASAFGKAILAYLPQEAQSAMLAIAWPKLTEQTVIEPEQMPAEWQNIRQCGLAFDHEEYQTGVCCIGAPIFGVDGAVVAGIGVMGPSYRLPEDRIRSFEAFVSEAATRVSAALGATV